MRPGFLLLMALAAGCQPETGALAVHTAGPPLTLEIVDPLEPGEQATIRVHGGNAFEPVVLGGSLRGTGTPICPPSLGGECVELLQPFIIDTQLTAPFASTATFTVTPPAPANVCLQAAITQTSTRTAAVSNVVCLPIQDEPCLAAPDGADTLDHPTTRVFDAHLTDRAVYTGTGSVFMTPDGIGVRGSSDAHVDANETVYIKLAGSASSVVLSTNLIDDADGDGVVGERFVRAFSSTGADLGHQTFFGQGQVDLSAAFGADIGAIAYSALGDRTSIDEISYEFNQAMARANHTVSFAGPGSSLSPHLDQGEVLVHRTDPTRLLQVTSSGLGMTGAGGGDLIDFGDALVFNFGRPVRNVRIRLGQQVEGPGSVAGMDLSLRTFDSDGVSSAAFSARADLNGELLISNDEISGFRLQVLSGDAFRVRTLDFRGCR